MIHETSFGTLDGRTVPLLTVTDGAFAVELLPFGAAVRAIRVPDRSGRAVDVALGYDSPEEYRQNTSCLGGTLGRCANRIGGAAFSLNGETVRLAANEGPNHLHGGVVGFHKRMWDYHTAGDRAVTFTLRSPDGEEGYPGEVQVSVTYTLQKGTLTLDYRAVTQRDTVVNLTNHTYFNLAGHDGGSVSDHTITVRASHYTPAGPGNIPTGEIADVSGTALDLRQGALLADRLRDLAASRGYDHNYVLDGGEGPAASVWCPRTGIRLDMTTTLPGMQLYTAGFLTPRLGKEGVWYGPGQGVCLETQFFPDAIHHPGFPSPILRAGQEFHAVTAYRFSV